MKRVLVAELAQCIEQIVLLKGWVKRIRRVGSRLAFVILRDNTGEVQAVLTGDIAQKDLSEESAVEITGLVVKNSKVDTGYEVQVNSIDVLGKARANLPFEVNSEHIDATFASILDNRAFSLRNKRVQAIFKVQSTITIAFQQFLNAKSFTQVKTPKLVASGAESGSSLFEVNYFGATAYLAQSPQLYKQMLVASGLERVYEVGPVFRAEEHKTSRHINEYISLDVEMGFITGMEELMNLEEQLLQYIFNELNTKCERELGLYEVFPLQLGKLPRLTLREMKDILSKEYNYQSTSKDIDPEGERLVCNYVRDKYGVNGVFLTEYPAEARPFYTSLKDSNPDLTNSFDLIYNGMEVTTGGQRINQPELLAARMKELGTNAKGMESYLEMFTLGMPPHGGFAIGLERITAQILDLANIKEACLFPRDMHRITP